MLATRVDNPFKWPVNWTLLSIVENICENFRSMSFLSGTNLPLMASCSQLCFCLLLPVMSAAVSLFIYLLFQFSCKISFVTNALFSVCGWCSSPWHLRRLKKTVRISSQKIRIRTQPTRRPTSKLKACFCVSTARPALHRNQGWERPLDFYVCFYSPTSWGHVKPTWLQFFLGGFLLFIFIIQSYKMCEGKYKLPSKAVVIL